MKKEPKLIFFTEYYYPADNSTSFYLTRIIRACAEAWAGPFRIFCATDNPGEEPLTGERIRITRFKGGKLNKNSLASRLIKFLLITAKFFWAALFRVRRGDTVFAVTNPAFLLVCLAFLRKIRKFRFVLLVYDIFPEVLIAGGLDTGRSLKYRLSLRVFNWAYDAADTLIVIGRDMQDVVAKKIHDPSKIVFIPNWSDTENIVSVPKAENPILKRYGFENTFVFSVAGNMGRTQGLDNIVEALSRGALGENASFLFMGGGAKLGEIRGAIESRKLDRVTATGWIPAEEQNAMLSACDVAVISLTKGMYGLSVPSKSYFNMAAGKPLLLIADPGSEIERVIEERKIGWHVPPEDPDALADVMRKIQSLSPEELSSCGERSRRTALECFSEEIVLKRYRQTIVDASEKKS